MSLWEYKVITSGKGGFARPDLMEKFLNDLGRDEWEIIQFHTQPDNFLVFTGLARRSTQRDWTLQDAAAAAAKAEAEKLRVEFEAKFKAANQPAAAGGGEERAPSFLEEKAAPEDGFRKPVDTSRDDEPEAAEEDKDDWDKLGDEDDLPSFFEAIKPHMRRNQRGPGMSVGVDYLAKKWDQTEEDLKSALVECGFVMPEDEDSKVEHVEYDGDLYWLNINRRGELWINTKEKPRPVFRSVKAQRIVIEEEAPKPQREREHAPKPVKETPEAEQAPASTDSAEQTASEGDEKAEKAEQTQQGGQQAPARENGQKQGQALPEGSALLGKIRPHMRRNRRGPGGSGSTTFLARALRAKEDDLKAAFVTLGLTMPASHSDKPVYAEIGNEVWWLNLDSRGGLWINGREKRQGETLAQAAAAAASDAQASEGSGSATATPEGGSSTGGAPAGDAAPATDAAPASTTEATPASSTDAAPTAEGTPSSTDAAAARTEAATAEPAAHAPAPTPAEAPSLSGTEREREAAPMPAEVSAPPASAPASTETAAAATEGTSAPAGGSTSSGSSSGVLAEVRPLLKETKSGAVAAKADRLAEELGKSADDVIAALVGAGLKLPEKAREKPVYADHAGESFWLSKNSRGELFLNAKAAKADEKPESEEDDESAEDAGAEGEEAGDATTEGGDDAEKKPRRTRSKNKKAE